MKQTIIITCEDCGQQFPWTSGEQEFYEEKGLERPKYCMICRGKHGAEKRQFGEKRDES